MKKLILVAALTLGIGATANAQYWKSSDGSIVRSDFGLCWVDSQGTWDAVDADLLECGDAKIVEIRTKHYLRVPSNDVPGGEILFEFDSAALDDRAVETIRAVVSEVPYNANVLVFGHTDAVGTEAYNMSLGQRRGEAAARLMLEGGDFTDVYSTSKGETELVVDTQERERQNRRVEIEAKWVEITEEVIRNDRP